MKKCEQMRFIRVVRFLKTLVGMARKRSWRSHRQPCFITMSTECMRITIDFSGITVFFFLDPVNCCEMGHRSCAVCLCFSRGSSSVSSGCCIGGFSDERFCHLFALLRLEVVMSTLRDGNTDQAIQIKVVLRSKRRNRMKETVRVKHCRL